MSDNKNRKKENKQPLTKANDIKGKLEISDKRERRDGPGGN